MLVKTGRAGPPFEPRRGPQAGKSGDPCSQNADRKKAEECFQKGSKIADAHMAVVELQEYQKNADPSDLLRAKKPATDSAF